MQSQEIRQKFLDFFKKRGHRVIQSASLVPENDPSVLFITAGMQPLVPYLMGNPHPSGKRLVGVQKCVRTQDIDEVGDKIHDTFFEMLGNWSLGDYFKKEAIAWSYEFLMSEEGLGLDPKRLYITVFLGNDDAPRDDESFEIWKSVGVPENRIYFLKENWWSAGENGPCGPDSEMFYDVTKKGLGDLTHEEFLTADKKQEVVEIWNDVFMEYEKKDGKVIGKLSQKNVDTGAGLERLSMVMQGKDDVFETDLFRPIIEKIEKVSGRKYLFKKGDLGFEEMPECWLKDMRIMRIIADHVRTATFMIGDGVVPSNTDRGYILRRILRRAIYRLGENSSNLSSMIDVVIEKYENVYPNLKQNQENIHTVFEEEVSKFTATIARGKKEFDKVSEGNISGEEAFALFSTYGFPIELTEELAKERSISVDRSGFDSAFLKHQEISRKGAEQKFKGGLAGHSEIETQYHTATHLLHKALQSVLGEHALQKGSNITTERLRFDFVHPQKMTDKEKKAVEDLVNKKIQEALPVSWEEMTLEEAKAKGAVGLFGDNYGDSVKVYQVGDEDKGVFSLELCGGPHVENTSELGHFRIKNEGAVSAGVRRIKAVLE